MGTAGIGTSGSCTLRASFRPPELAFYFVVSDMLLLSGALLFASALRFDFEIPDRFQNVVLATLPAVLLVKYAFSRMLSVYRGVIRYTSLGDLVRLILAHGLSALFLLSFSATLGLFGMQRLPYSILIIEFFVSVGLCGGSRLAYRHSRELLAARSSAATPGIQALLAGAGDSGVMAIKRMRRDPDCPYRVVGFLDDDTKKHGMTIEGMPVLGGLDAAAQIIDGRGIREIIFAIPSLSGDRMRQVVDRCKQKGVRFSRLPALQEILDGTRPGRPEALHVEDLLRRDPVQFNSNAVRALLKGRSVLVTGAGGSIGSELCRQIAAVRPETLVLFERFENNLYLIDKELRGQSPFVTVIPFVGDITDNVRLRSAFRRFMPDVVFHAAAHKHVPMMEANPVEAVKNNVFGTLNVARAADQFGTAQFVMISTDKAVHPTSIMGAAKRIAEIVCQCHNEFSKTRFTTVRFGNVLNSAGSVIPLFSSQISRGKPVTVTHPEMTRYFMTIPEAAQLVLQAASMGKGGEIMLLEMGEQIRILDLASDMIKLNGLIPNQDIPIRITGLRPGEKLHEELFMENEEILPTSHPKVKIAKCSKPDSVAVFRTLEELAALIAKNADGILHKRLLKLVPDDPRPAPGKSFDLRCAFQSLERMDGRAGPT